MVGELLELENEYPGEYTGIPVGPWLFAMDSALSTPGRVHVMDADSLDYLGQVPTGLNAQMVIDNSRRRIYVAGTYYSRGYRGIRTDVIEAHGLETLKFERELEIPQTRALSVPTRSAMQLSSGDRWLFIQNVSPASSVTIVDLDNWKVVSEIPNPGCFGTYPLTGARAGFVSVCGDGSLTSYRLDSNGSGSGFNHSNKLFDVERDPWFMFADQDGPLLFFVSYLGVLNIVDTSGDMPKLQMSTNFVEGKGGNWRPGGYQLDAYHKPSRILFVLMHPDGKEGSHKDTGSEVWAVDTRNGNVVSRSNVDDLDAITVSGDREPVLHGVEPGGVYIIRYVSDPREGYAVTRDTYEEVGNGMPHIELVPVFKAIQ